MRKFIVSISIALLTFFAVSAQQTTSFSYQGKMNSGSSPTNGLYDFRFELYDAQDGGTLIGTTIRNGVTVTNGIFNTQLDFGANAFDGGDRFLDISVKLPSSGSYGRLLPRQRIASVPYATKSINADNAVTAQNSDSLGGVSAANYLQRNGDGSQLTNLSGGNIAPGSVTSAQLSPDAIPNNNSLKLLGSLRWDLLKAQTDFPVGGNVPRAIAFDGANIWVANVGSNNVTKMRASDGVIIGNYPVGTSPVAVAFDGANIWVVNSSSNNVTKLRASDGSSQGTFTVGSSPAAIAFDGTNIWVVNSGSNNVTKLRTDGTTVSTFAVGSAPQGIAFDGANIWVTNQNSNNVTRLRADLGLTQFTLAVGAAPEGIAFDGTNIWIALTGSNSVVKVTAEGSIVGTYNTFNVPRNIAFDGFGIWVTNIGGGVVRLRASDGALLGIFNGGTNPLGIAFDGSNVWAASSGSNSVIRLVPAFPQP